RILPRSRLSSILPASLQQPSSSLAPSNSSSLTMPRTLSLLSRANIFSFPPTIQKTTPSLPRTFFLIKIPFNNTMPLVGIYHSQLTATPPTTILSKLWSRLSSDKPTPLAHSTTSQLTSWQESLTLRRARQCRSFFRSCAVSWPSMPERFRNCAPTTICEQKAFSLFLRRRKALALHRRPSMPASKRRRNTPKPCHPRSKKEDRVEKAEAVAVAATVGVTATSTSVSNSNSDLTTSNNTSSNTSSLSTNNTLLRIKQRPRSSNNNLLVSHHRSTITLAATDSTQHRVFPGATADGVAAEDRAPS
ncbi:hypothetical protein BGZ95_007691, partial [Linnemannia exigua]